MIFPALISFLVVFFLSFFFFCCMEAGWPGWGDFFLSLFFGFGAFMLVGVLTAGPNSNDRITECFQNGGVYFDGSRPGCYHFKDWRVPKVNP